MYPATKHNWSIFCFPFFKRYNDRILNQLDGSTIYVGSVRKTLSLHIIFVLTTTEEELDRLHVRDRYQ